MRKRIALLLLPIAVVALSAAKCGESTKDDAPATIKEAVIDQKYGPETPLSSGKKCTYGSFRIATRTEFWQVCASSKAEYANAKIGSPYSR